MNFSFISLKNNISTGQSATEVQDGCTVVQLIMNIIKTKLWVSSST